ncbi:MAG: hypothetical protein WC451_03095 [Patescibacteria group bacterium]|jgi:hypothetical protein
MRTIAFLIVSFFVSTVMAYPDTVTINSDTIYYRGDVVEANSIYITNGFIFLNWGSKMIAHEKIVLSDDPNIPGNFARVELQGGYMETPLLYGEYKSPATYQVLSMTYGRLNCYHVGTGMVLYNHSAEFIGYKLHEQDLIANYFADINKDGIVNFEDFAYLAQWWLDEI